MTSVWQFSRECNKWLDFEILIEESVYCPHQPSSSSSIEKWCTQVFQPLIIDTVEREKFFDDIFFPIARDSSSKEQWTETIVSCMKQMKETTAGNINNTIMTLENIWCVRAFSKV